MYKRYLNALETRFLDSACAVDFLSASCGVCISGVTSLFSKKATYSAIMPHEGTFRLKHKGAMDGDASAIFNPRKWCDSEVIKRSVI